MKGLSLPLTKDNSFCNIISTRNVPFTVNRTTFRESPRIFVAEHWYRPVSLPVTCFNCNFPPETADCLIFDWFSRLLHINSGSGLPLAEHWNEAVPPSFTVNVTGETTTAGDDIDSPGSPFLPGMPAGPISPFSPLVPGSPINPAGPIMPCFPLFPGDPIIPRSPLFPVLPFCPLLPRAPFVPGGPGGPGGPDEHVTLFDWHRCALHCDKRCLLILTVVSAVSFASVAFLVDTTWRLFLLRFWISANKRK